MRRKKSPPLDPEIAELERQRDALQHAIRELQIEHDLLRTASELIKKDIGGDLQSLNNREKTLLIVALKNQYKTPELMARLGLPRSSYFYHRTRITLEDKYLPVRHIMADILRKQPSLLWLSSSHSLPDAAFHHDIRESRAAVDEAGSLGRPNAQAAAIQLLSGRNQPRAR